MVEKSFTGKVDISIKDPLPEDAREAAIADSGNSYITAEQGSTAVVAGATDVHPLSVNLPDTQLFNNLNQTFPSSNQFLTADTPDIGSADYNLTAPTFKYGATTGESYIDDSSDAIDFYQSTISSIKPMDAEGKEMAAQYGLFGDPRMSGAGTLTDYRTSEQQPIDTEEFSSLMLNKVIGNTKDYKKGFMDNLRSIPINPTMAMGKVWSAASELNFIKDLKKNPGKYYGKTKKINASERWFAKQAQDQFGAVFESNPVAGIKVAEANKAIYDYLQTTTDGRGLARKMGLNSDLIERQFASAKSYESESNKIAQSYSSYQGTLDTAEDVARRKDSYSKISDDELNKNRVRAGDGQNKGMAIGGKGVYVDISDGIASGTKFKSGTIFVKWKKEEREKRQVKQPRVERQREEAKDRMQRQEGQHREIGSRRQRERYQRDVERSGVSRMAYGDRVRPMTEEKPNLSQDNNAGNLEFVQEQGKDQSGVADDVSRELGAGDYVVNAPAVIQAGRGDLDRLVKRAKEELATIGVVVDGDKEGGVDVRVSNGEYIIPKIIAEQIGYDRLEKINNRGKEKVDKIEKEQVQQQEQIQQNPQPEQQPRMVQSGGMISQTLDENKNSPIAIPRETLSGQSSIGQQLISPLSPKQQDEERELKKTSFEGFMKPIKLNQGSVVQNQKVTRGDRNNSPFNLHSIPTTDTFFGVIGRDTKNLTDDMPKNGFLMFNNTDDGLRAGAYILRNQYNNMTADEIINTFSETDKTEYIAAIKEVFGDRKINTQNSEDLIPLMKIMIKQEANTKTFSDKELLNAVNRSKVSLEDSPFSQGEPVKELEQGNIKSGGMMAEGGITKPTKSEEYRELTEEDMINLGVKAAAALALQNPTIKQNAEKFKNAIDLKLAEVIPNNRMRKYVTQLATEGMIKEEFDLPRGFKGEAGVTKEGQGFLGASLSF